MAKGAYIGVNGVARKVKKRYVGGHAAPQAGHPEHIRSTAGYLMFSYGGRNFKKKNAGDAYCASYTILNSLGPILVGRTADAVKFCTDGDYNLGSSGAHPVSFKGETWYVSDTTAFMTGTTSSPTGNVNVAHLNALTGVFSYDSVEAAALDFLAYVLPQASVRDADYLLYSFSGRNYKKKSAEEAYCASVVRNGWLSPLIVGKTIDSVYYYTDGDYSTVCGNGGTVNFNGETWYYCGSGAAFSTSANPNGNVPHLNAVTGVANYATMADAALALLEYVTTLPKGDNVARLVKKAYVGVNGVARQYYADKSYVFQEGIKLVGNATSSEIYMVDEGDGLYAYVKRTANDYTDTQRTLITFVLTGLKTGDSVAVTYTAQLGAYMGFCAYPANDGSKSLFGGYQSQTNHTETFIYPDAGAAFRLDNGLAGTSEAWVRIHKVTVNGEQVYPY